MCCIDPLFSCADWVDCSDVVLLFIGRTATVQYLVEETTAQVNATDNVSNANSVKRCLLYVLVCIHWVLIHVYRRVEILMVLKFEPQK